VILAAYRRWGEQFVDHLVGMFAVALVDRRRRRLVLARDRLGIKPLYLAESPGRLRFASTLPALLTAGDVDTTIDPVGLHHYLTWHSIVPAPHTILRGVRKLPAATVRVVEADGRSRDRVYWRPDYVRDPAHAGMTAHDWSETIGAALRTAVRRRVVADVPVGVLLSGGLDSSMIVALLAETGARGGYRRSASASTAPAANRATSSATPTWSRGSSGPRTTGSRSRRRAWSPRSTARSAR